MGMVRSQRRTDGKGEEKSAALRRLTCGQVMSKPHVMSMDDTMAKVLDRITRKNWDHIFLVDSDRAPAGRIHAVDVLKMIATKTVNRDIAWMHAITAREMVTQPPLTVRIDTPLLKACALMITHDLNQVAVVDYSGEMVGVISMATIAKHLPRFIL